MDIICKNLYFSYDKENYILNNINYKFLNNKITTISGESGIGKSTLLNIIAKKLKPTKGEVIYSENPNIAYVYQDDRLVPFLTSLQNINLVLDKNKIKEDIASYYLEKLKIYDAKNKLPREMSIGMQHRLSIARALAYKSNLLLIDEPFTSLDDENKLKTLNLVLKVIKDEQITTLMVTHDKDLIKFLGTNNLEL